MYHDTSLSRNAWQLLCAYPFRISRRVPSANDKIHCQNSKSFRGRGECLFIGQCQCSDNVHVFSCEQLEDNGVRIFQNNFYLKIQFFHTKIVLTVRSTMHVLWPLTKKAIDLGVVCKAEKAKGILLQHSLNILCMKPRYAQNSSCIYAINFQFVSCALGFTQDIYFCSFLLKATLSDLNIWATVFTLLFVLVCVFV